ncbi:MAG: hypothetical protein WA418_08095 [Bradyrhizobium sp.]
MAACYYEPGPEFAEEKVFDSMVDAAGPIDLELAARAGWLGEAFAAAAADWPSLTSIRACCTRPHKQDTRLSRPCRL